MTSPIHDRIGIIFIPISDMPCAVAWYSQLFELPIGQTTHEDRIYNVPMAGENGIILDSHKPVVNSSQPICFSGLTISTKPMPFSNRWVLRS